MIDHFAMLAIYGTGCFQSYSVDEDETGQS